MRLPDPPPPMLEPVPYKDGIVIVPVSVSIWELMYTWWWTKMVRQTLNSIEGKPMEQEAGILDSLKGFLSGFLVRWIMKAAGGALLGVGISEGSVTEVVGGVLTFAIGIIVSLFQQKKAINTPAPAQNPQP